MFKVKPVVIMLAYLSLGMHGLPNIPQEIQLCSEITSETENIFSISQDADSSKKYNTFLDLQNLSMWINLHGYKFLFLHLIAGQIFNYMNNLIPSWQST